MNIYINKTIMNPIVLLTMIALLIVKSEFVNESNNLRKKRSLTTISTDMVNCVSVENGVCICPGICMEPYKNNTICKLIDCYGWNTNIGECHQTGPDYTSAIILQALPFTGIFGSGFGNIGRWDIFELYMVAVFVPLAIFIISGCCVLPSLLHNNDRFNSCKHIYFCIGSAWMLAILTLWVWGIVIINNKDILGPNGCSLH